MLINFLYTILFFYRTKSKCSWTQCTSRCVRKSFGAVFPLLCLFCPLEVPSCYSSLSWNSQNFAMLHLISFWHLSLCPTYWLQFWSNLFSCYVGSVFPSLLVLAEHGLDHNRQIHLHRGIPAQFHYRHWNPSNPGHIYQLGGKSRIARNAGNNCFCAVGMRRNN